MTALEAIARFAGHVFSGTVMFLLIAIPAICLHLLISFVPWPRDSEYLRAGLILLEYTIFGIDALVFVAYLIISGYRFVRELLR
jgi:hypothetical protein